MFYGSQCFKGFVQEIFFDNCIENNIKVVFVGCFGSIRQCCRVLRGKDVICWDIYSVNKEGDFVSIVNSSEYIGILSLCNLNSC